MQIRRNSFRLTRGGWALLVLCVLMSLGAFNAGLNMIYLLASLLIAVFTVALAAPLWSIHGMTCRRVIPEMPFAGESYEIRHSLESRRRTVARLVVVTEPLAGSAAKGGRKLLLRVAPYERVNLVCVGQPLRRGVYALPGIRWSSRFPFGVAECGGESVGSEELAVYPARGQLSRLVVSALKPRGMRVGSPSRVGLPGEDFRSLREYVSGDNPRWVHWHASAHHNKLFVREMERERSAPVLILLDSRLPASLPASQRAQAAEALERAISFAAEVCRVAMHEGNQAALVAFTPEPTVIGRGAPAGAKLGAFSARHYRQFLEALARLQPSTEEQATRLLDTAEAAGLGTAWRVMAVSPTPRTAAPLRHALGRWSAHVYVASAPEFDNVFRLLAPEPGSGA